MADKGILVNDQTGGESIACVDLRNQDDGSNDRVVQLVSPVTSPATLPAYSATALRTIQFGDYEGGGTATNGDSYTVGGGAVDLTNTDFLDVTDCSCFMLYGVLDIASITDTNVAGDGDSVEVDDNRILITPVLYPVTGTAAATPLHTALLRFWDQSGLGSSTPYEGDVAQTAYDKFGCLEYYQETGDPDTTENGMEQFKIPFFPLVFPTFGASRVKFHVHARLVTQGNLKIFGVALSGEAATAALTQVHTSDHHLSSARLRTYKDGNYTYED